MKQIYNFENQAPPVINENIIREKIQKRRLRRNIILTAMCSALTLLCSLAFALVCLDIMHELAVFMLINICISIVGGAAIGLVYIKNRRLFVK